MAKTGRPRKYPAGGARNVNVKLHPDLHAWMEQSGTPKTVVLTIGAELLLSLRSPASRPAGYELSEETRALLAELKADESEKPDPK